ncbi:hypothetical protein WJX72_001588 [[Myrmecia] bisecta]|uniref:Uncharacterized protein n=1 Tax=[Myrmecia] bisecta TaxID=41462 RepID=A0AAW1QPD8_9CHLO
MDAFNSVYNGPPGGKVKLCSTGALALAILATLWQPDLSAAVSVLGVLAVVLSNGELLQLFIYFNPATLVIDVLQLFLIPHKHWYSFIVLLKLVEILTKAAGTWYAYELFQATGGVDPAGGSYQPFNGPAPGTSSPNRTARNDPFASQTYAPPRANPNLYNPPASPPQGYPPA